MKTKTKIISLLSIVTGMLFASVTTSLAWFTKSNFITTDQDNPIKGSMFTGYFHCGSGTSTDPFVITKPVHWENLVWLHNNVDAFWRSMRKDDESTEARGFDFQIGYDLDGTGVPKVYKFDENGQVFENGQPVYDTTLNLACLDELIPIGSPQYPFVGTMNGNDLTISNFNIVSYDKYHEDALPLEDIGIFGYVGDATVDGSDTGPIHNLYFTHFNIDTSKGSLVKDDSQLYRYHPTHIDPDTKLGDVCTGYIAGHALKALSFTDVYVNDCTIDGKADTSGGQANNFGYFGKIEFSAEGNEIGQGNAYGFELNAEKVYNYLSANYTSGANLSQSPIATYTEKYSGEEKVVYNSDYHVNESKNNLFNDDYQTIHPGTEGISYIEKGIAGWRSTYNLMGKDPDDAYTGPTNYSLSSLGYWEMSNTSRAIDFTAVIPDGNTGNYKLLPTDVKYPGEIDPSTGQPYNQPDYNTALNTYGFNQKYIYYDNSQGWVYNNVHNAEADVKEVNIHIHCENLTFTTDQHLFSKEGNPIDGTQVGQLYVDGQMVNSGTDLLPTNVTYKRNTNWINYGTITYTLNMDYNFKISLARGKHYISYVCGWTNRADYSKFATAYSAYGTRVSYSNGRNFNINNYGEINFAPDGYTSDVSYDSSSKKYTLDLTVGSLSTRENTSVSADAVINFVKPSGTFIATPYHYPETSQTLIYGCTLPKGQPITPTGCEILPKSNKIVFSRDNEPYPSPTSFHFVGGYQLYGKDNEYNTISVSPQSGGDGWKGTYTMVNGGTTDTLVVRGDGTATLNGTNVLYNFDSDAKTVLRFTINRTSVEGDDYSDVYYIEKVPDDIPYSRYVAHYDTPKEVVGDTPHWIGEELEEYTKSETEPGYSRENIDIVGGGIRFGNNFVTFDGEERTTTLMKTLTAEDIGKKWYATSYAANCVVLYVKNVAGVNPLDQIGTVEIDYSWLTTFNELCFKKGYRLGTVVPPFTVRGNSIKIDEISRTADQDINDEQTLLHRNVKLKLRRQSIKNASFCALDANKNIIANYNAEGTQVFPEGRTVNDADIAYFVLCVGIQNPLLGGNVNTRINYIRFNYNADRGAGGSFGRVEFREPPLASDKTVFNFAYRVPEEDYIKVHVTYGSYNDSGEFVDDKRYYLNLYYYCPSDATRKLELFLYLYDDQYEVYLCTDPNNPTAYTRVCQNVNEQVLVESHNF